MNDEKKVGYKQLSVADLGLGTSHQTHIGLYEKMLDFLDNSDSTNGMLIYNDYCEILPCYFDRISMPNGSYRSPKIRKGTDSENTIVKQIREFAKENPNRKYYLLWFGLDSNELLFWLIDNTSEDYTSISKYFHKDNAVYDDSLVEFSVLLQFIENKINKVSISIQQDLEISAQVGLDGIIAKMRKYRPIDIEKAQKRFKDTGRKGEELVNEYLDRLKFEKEIISYRWENKDRELGMPFDFTVYNKQNHENYVDVKSTLYMFEQPLVFSNGEIHFIQSVPDENYSVFRVYDMNELNTKLRVCQRCLSYMKGIDSRIMAFESEMSNSNAKVQEMKIAIKPNDIGFGCINEAVHLPH